MHQPAMGSNFADGLDLSRHLHFNRKHRVQMGLSFTLSPARLFDCARDDVPQARALIGYAPDWK